MKKETESIVRIPLADLHPFPAHPYGIRDDPAMQDTADSVKANGVVDFTITIPVDKLRKYFPKTYTPARMEV